MSARHPLESISLLSRLNNFWTFSEMAKSSKASYHQEVHYPLPDADRLMLNRDLMAEQFKGSRSLIKSIWKIFSCYIIGLCFLIILYNFCAQSGPFVLGMIVRQLIEDRVHTNDDRMWLGIYCGYMVVAALLGPMFFNFVCFSAKRLGLRISAAVNMMVFEKISRVNAMNKSEHSSGNILNYVQIDCEKFFLNLPKAIELFSSIVQATFCMIVLYSQVRNAAFVVLGVFLLGMIMMTGFYKWRLGCMDALMQAKDSRVLTLTNVIQNIKFIKMKGWENYFQYKVSVKRDHEMKYLFRLACFNGGELYLMWMNQSVCTIVLMLTLVYYAPQYISLGVISVCLSVMWNVFDAIIVIPLFAGMLLDFRISLRRVTRFLNHEEISYQHFKNDPEVLKEYGVFVQNGSFYWNAVRSDEDQAKRPKRNENSMALSESLLNDTIKDTDDKGFVLENINFRAKKGELVFVIGKIGSGKSSLLYAILGEMNKSSDDNKTIVHRDNKAAMLSQTPWLLPSTVRANILLDKEFDQEQFDRALRISQLSDDIKEMADGIETFIGENGQTVSGGQRTRIALARCIYQDPDLYVLDDPLSALDLKVADKIMKEGISGELRGKKTIIIATHAIHNLKYADYVYVVDHGKIAFEGTFEEVNNSPIYNEFKAVTDDYATEEVTNPELEDVADEISSRTNTEMKRKSTLKMTRRESTLREDFFLNAAAGEDATKAAVVEPKKKEIDSVVEAPLAEEGSLINRLFMDEDRVQGKLGFGTILTVIKEMGGIVPIILSVMSVVTLCSMNFLSDYYHLQWSQYHNPDRKFEYLWFLISILLMRCLMNLIRSGFVFGTQLIMSKNIHARMLFRVLHAQIGEFLERVPAGRIINRFTKDIEVIDKDIGWSFSGVYIEGASVLINICILIWSIGPMLVIPMSLFLLFGIMFQRKLMTTKREIVRLEAVARSPVMSCVGALIRGNPEIRVLQKEKFVKDEYVEKVELVMKNSLLIAGLDHWYMNIVNICNVFLIQLPGFLIINYFIYFSGEAYPLPKLILFVLKSIEISAALIVALLNVSMLETQMISVERCSKFSKIEPEKRYFNFAIHEKKYLHPNSKEVIVKIMKDLEKTERSVITHGKVNFLKVTAKYPTKPAPVLNNLTLAVKPGEKIGIVGRTGAGKTSLIKLFWMCLDPSEGKLIVDGKDVMKIDLKVLRSNLDIISQETAIFEGTLRENLDPKLEYLYDKNSEVFKQKDRELLHKLYEIGFKEEHLDGKGLDFQISAGGDNLSLGQKQLLCFTRVLIAPKKLMILDEATANIDLKTEQLMQNAVRHEFKDSTMFIIAHRIQTVLECDKICLMEYGKIAEFGTPKELIRKPGSKFGEIYKKLKENIGDD